MSNVETLPNLEGSGLSVPSQHVTTDLVGQSILTFAAAQNVAPAVAERRWAIDHLLAAAQRVSPSIPLVYYGGALAHDLGVGPFPDDLDLLVPTRDKPNADSVAAMIAREAERSFGAGVVAPMEGARGLGCRIQVAGPVTKALMMIGIDISHSPHQLDIAAVAAGREWPDLGPIGSVPAITPAAMAGRTLCGILHSWNGRPKSWVVLSELLRQEFVAPTAIRSEFMREMLMGPNAGVICDVDDLSSFVAEGLAGMLQGAASNASEEYASLDEVSSSRLGAFAPRVAIIEQALKVGRLLSPEASIRPLTRAARLGLQ